MVLIQLLLPTKTGQAGPIADRELARTRQELIARFGGLTAYLRAPAAGAWRAPEGDVERDDVVMVEVVTETFDRAWWRQYKRILEQRLDQKAIHVRALAIDVVQ